MADLTINLAVAGAEVVTGALRRVGEVAINALGAALGKVADFASDSFKGALEAQKGIDALSASITRLGGKAPVTMAGAEALADQFKNLVGGSDDAVLAMVNMGLRFDKISSDTFPDFIKQSADLAAVLKVDPVKASEILGKALQDLSVDGVGSIGRLKAAGVAFTDEQEKLIKKLVESGDVAGAQKVLFDALAETTGGAAAAAADTLQGKWAIFQETIADAGEGVALKLLPVLTQLADAVLPKIIPIVENVASVLSNLIGYLTGGDLGDAGYAVFELFNGLFGKEVGIQAEQTFYQIIDAITAFASQAQEWITNVAVPAFQSAVAWVQANWPMIQATIADVWAQAQPVLQAIWDFIQTVVIPAFNSAVQWVIVNWPMIQATIATVMAQVQSVIQTILTAIQAFWNEWGDEITSYVQAFIDNVQVIFSAFSAAFEGDWRKFGEILRVAWDEAWQNIQAIVAAAIDWFGKQDWGKIGTDILKGIANGITSASGWIVDAAIAAARAAFDAVTGFFDNRSPSHKMFKEGLNVGRGLALGIASAGPEIATATRTASAGAYSVVNNSGGNTYNYYGVQADMQSAYNRAVAGALA